MLRLTSEHRSPLARAEDWGERHGLRTRRPDPGPPVGLLVAGAVVIGLGVLTWTYLGPDLRRYLKIHSM